MKNLLRLALSVLLAASLLANASLPVLGAENNPQDAITITDATAAADTATATDTTANADTTEADTTTPTTAPDKTPPTTVPKDEASYSSDPVADSVRLESSGGGRLGSVNEKSRNFTIIVEYTDYGLRGMERPGENSKAYISGSAFLPNDGVMNAKISYLSGEGTTDSPYRFQVRFTGMSWDGSAKSFNLELFYKIGSETEKGSLAVTVNQASVSKSDPDEKDKEKEEDPPLAADITVESVTVTDAGGKHISEVTDENSAFNIQIVFADYGLIDVGRSNIGADDIEVFMTNASFLPSGSGKGVIQKLSTSRDMAPRFRAEFKNLTWDGVANDLTMTVRYAVKGETFKGDVTATVYQAKIKKDEKEGEEEQIVPPPTPYIIVTEYDTGDDLVQAGQRFTLALTFKNTSGILPLENIVMTIEPGENFSIASASNTYYIPNLAPGASLGHSLELEAKSAAKAGSHNLNITFTYEYLVQKTEKITERVSKESKESIAMTISQIDRFSVDPITEAASGQIGEASYVTVSFVNRGASATNNISAQARGNLQITNPWEHFGSLEGGGASDSIDVTVVPQESGELYGEIVVQYEDDNRNQKELSVPFTMFIEEPYDPSMEDPGMLDPGIMEEEPQTHNWIQIALYAAGGLLMAVPVALYVMKRKKAKAADIADDDF